MSTPPEDARHSLSRLEGALVDAFEPEMCGFPWYASIEDRVVRAVRSNQLIGLVDAATSHLDALREAAGRVRELVGPNGRTTPAPEDTAARAELERIHVEITDALRAAGSLLDVLGALAVLFLGLPFSPTFADSRQLLECEPEPAQASDEQRVAVTRMREVVGNAVNAGPAGWVAWTLESRNAMVHRGRSIAIWLPVPATGDRAQIVVVTNMNPVRVIRQFPHLRRQPDLSDAESVLSGAVLEDVFLHEPAQDTLGGLYEYVSRLTTAVAEAMHGLIDELAAFTWPSERWALARRSNRALLADQFAGFDPDRPAVDLTALYMNPRDAMRLGVMERLRREQSA